MSSSDGVTTRNQTHDTLARTRDQYEDREAELIKRHKKELARIQKEHAQELEHVRENADTAVDNMRDGSRKSLSEKEAGHVRQIEQLQDVSRKKLAQQRADSDDKYGRTTDTLKSENSRESAAHDKRERELSEAYMKNMREKDRSQETHLENEREGHLDTFARYREESNDRMSNQEKEAAAQRQALLEKANHNYEDLRHSKYQEVRELEGKAHNQKEMLQNQKAAELKRTQTEYQRNMDRMRAGSETSMADTKERFQKSAEANKERYQENFENFRTHVDDRVNNQVNRLENQNTELRRENMNDSMNQKMRFDREKADYAKKWNENLGELEHRRVAAAEDSKRHTDQEIHKLNTTFDRERLDTHAMYHGKLDEQKRVLREGAEEQITEIARDREYTKAHSVQEQKKIAEAYANKMAATTEFSEEQIGTLKRGFERALQEQREATLKSHHEELRGVEERYAKQNMDTNLKMQDLSMGYEKKLGDLRSEYEKRIRRMDEVNKERLTAQVKSAGMDREQSESRMQARINEIKNTYEKEISQLQRRQEQERRELATKKV